MRSQRQKTIPNKPASFCTIRLYLSGMTVTRATMRTCSARKVASGSARKKAVVMSRPTSSSVKRKGVNAKYRIDTLAPISKTIPQLANAARHVIPINARSRVLYARALIGSDRTWSPRCGVNVSGQEPEEYVHDIRVPYRLHLPLVQAKLTRLPREMQSGLPLRMAQETQYPVLSA